MSDLLLIVFLAGIAWLLWRAYASRPTPAPPPIEPPRKEDPETRHVRNALEFAKAQHGVLAQKQREHEAWQQAHGHARAGELDQLSGTEFEAFLAGLFRTQGYTAELTPLTGDYGADLILFKNGKRIAVQAKRYAGSVGVSAVQEALSGQAYYQCDIAWVVTTGTFTNNALELAKKSGVKLIGRSDIGKLMAQRAANAERSQSTTGRK